MERVEIIKCLVVFVLVSKYYFFHHPDQMGLLVLQSANKNDGLIIYDIFLKRIEEEKNYTAGVG